MEGPYQVVAGFPTLLPHTHLVGEQVEEERQEEVWAAHMCRRHFRMGQEVVDQVTLEEGFQVVGRGALTHLVGGGLLVVRLEAIRGLEGQGSLVAALEVRLMLHLVALVAPVGLEGRQVVGVMVCMVVPTGIG